MIMQIRSICYVPGNVQQKEEKAFLWLMYFPHLRNEFDEIWFVPGSLSFSVRLWI